MEERTYEEVLAAIGGMGPEKAAQVALYFSSAAKLTVAEIELITQLTGITEEQASLAKAWAATQVEVNVDVEVRPRALRPGADRLRTAMGRLSQAAGVVSGFDFDHEAVLGFAALFGVYGYEVAGLDHYVLKALNEGAGRFIQDDWVLALADSYKTNKPSAHHVRIPENPDRDILDAFDLEIVDEQARVNYWQKVTKALHEARFFTLIEQLAYYHRATGKASVLKSAGTNVVSTMQDARYDPGQIERLHRDFLRAASRFMEDRTYLLTGDRIANEHVVAVLPLIEDEDVLYFLCRPPRNVKDVFAYFWNTEQLDVSLERAGIRFGQAIMAAIEILATYDSSIPYQQQLLRYAELANEAYTCLEELGMLTPKRYGFAASPQPGITGIVANLTAAITVRVKINVGGRTVEVEARAEVSTGVSKVEILRGVLLDSFTAEEFNRMFLFTGYPKLKPIRNRLSGGLARMVDDAIDYCERSELTSQLVDESIRNNPAVRSRLTERGYYR